MPSQAKTRAGIYRAVWEGRLKKTPGGLTEKDLMISPNSGKIISKKRYKAGKKAMARLRACGKAAPKFTKKSAKKKKPAKKKPAKKKPAKKKPAKKKRSCK